MPSLRLTFIHLCTKNAIELRHDLQRRQYFDRQQNNVVTIVLFIKA